MPAGGVPGGQRAGKPDASLQIHSTFIPTDSHLGPPGEPTVRDPGGWGYVKAWVTEGSRDGPEVGISME
jgi:hypothetical protein